MQVSIKMWITIGTLTGVGASAAHADNSKKGLYVGTSIGVSLMAIDGSQSRFGASAPNLTVGYRWSDKFALSLVGVGAIYEYKSMGPEDRQRQRGWEGVVVELKHWVTDQLWVEGGIGLAMDAPVFYDTSPEEARFHFGGTAQVGGGADIARVSDVTFTAATRVRAATVSADGQRRNGVTAEILVGLIWKLSD